ncbi:hypothetical protein F5B21DRAFT_502772 [Xylaria acuta]|nr:hypothetical protein F5B21DRAFT_502772 [Xylaria acuta]
MSGSSDDIEKRRAKAKRILAIRAGGLGGLLDDAVGKEARQHFRDNMVARGNTPSIEEHFVSRDKWRPSVSAASERLWVASNHRSIRHRVMSNAPLPTGEVVSQPLDEEEWFLITRAYSDWAPPPFNAEEVAPIDRINHLVGSNEEPDRMQIISRELQAMKARLWEGIMPLSARRWREKKLYDPNNFSAACRFLSMAINVFSYLNLGVVQATMRETLVLLETWRDVELQARLEQRLRIICRCQPLLGLVNVGRARACPTLDVSQYNRVAEMYHVLCQTHHCVELLPGLRSAKFSL